MNGELDLSSKQTKYIMLYKNILPLKKGLDDEEELLIVDYQFHAFLHLIDIHNPLHFCKALSTDKKDE
jgi:hypothetical protein